MLYALVVLLLALWLLGFIASIGGGLIHVLLVLAVIVLLFRLLGVRGGTDI